MSPAAASAAAVTPLNPAVEIGSMVCASYGNCTAVGQYTDGAGNGQGLLLSESNGTWRRGTEATLPANAGPDPMQLLFNTGISDVSCASAGNCAAVGIYTDDTDQDRGLLLTQRNGKWQRGVEAHLPGNAMGKPKKAGEIGDNLLLLGVSCASAGNCYAVGNYVTTSNTVLPIILAEQNGLWGGATVAPLPTGAAVRGQDATLDAIKCLPDGTCSAVGGYVDGNGDKQAMLLTESGGVWNATEATIPAGAATSPTAIPIALDCAATGDCSAVGIFEDSHQDLLGLLLSEASGSWAAGTEASLPTNAAPPTSYNAQTTLVDSINCPDTEDCAAVGSYTDSDGNTQALLLNQTAGAWATGQQVTLPSNANATATDQSASLDTVSCASAGNCVTGGEYTDTAQNFQSMLVTETNGVWAPGVEVPLPSNAGQSQFSEVSSVRCAAVGSCSALGVYSDHSGGQFAFALNEANGQWGSASAIAVPAITSLQIKTAVNEMLTPIGKDATVASIRKAGSFKLAYNVLEPGKLTVSWYSGKLKDETLIATARATDKTIGSTDMVVHLNAAGKALFRAGGKIKLHADVVFAPTGHRQITATGSFTLK